jgi:class 3 adenylate cyclase
MSIADGRKNARVRTGCKAIFETDGNMAPNVSALFSDENPHDPDSQKWLSGNEVLAQTGISKRDLIRFIQLRVLPKSMMRVSPAGPDGRGKKSYFAAAILGHVAMLKRLRQEGHTVEEIAHEMRDAAGDAARPQPTLSNEPEPTAPMAGPAPHTAAPPRIHLLTDAIATAAFFVDHDLRIAWIKAGQGDRLSLAIQAELADDPSGTVLDIILRASLKELVFNWPPLFAFTYRFLQETTAEETFERLAPTVSLNLEEADHPDQFPTGRITTGPIDSCPIRLEEADGQVQQLRFYGIALSEGTLFLLDDDRWRDAPVPVQPKETAAARPFKGHAVSRKTPFGVLSARLDDSRTIVDTLLPEAFFQLMTRIWDESDRILASYGGQRAKRSGTEVQYIIPRHNDTDPAYDAIRCAVELKKKMREIEDSLRKDGGWFADIRLNIGISSGSDHLKQDDLTASLAFMLPGGAADQALHLSAIAHGGAIWITKSAFGHLSPRQMAHITFGIYRNDKLIPNIFAQVSDLPHAPGTPPLARGIQALSVTRIIGLKPD